MKDKFIIELKYNVAFVEARLVASKGFGNCKQFAATGCSDSVNPVYI
jgi:hypothetical protein